MAMLLTVLGIAGSFVIAAGMMISIITDYRFWPPGERDWRWWTYILLSGLPSIALVVVGYLDWNTFILPRPESLLIGAVLLVTGVLGFVAATFDLGTEESAGLEGDLHTNGFYRYTRNPQIIYLSLILLGSLFVTNARLLVPLCLAMGLWFVIMPFAEEPWLRKQYGDTYTEYCQEVPRFVGRTTLVELFDNSD